MEENVDKTEQIEKNKSSGGRILFWTVIVIILIVWIDSFTDSAFGIISAFTNPEHTWYENIINEFTPSPAADTEWGDAIMHGLSFPINFVINIFIDHPYKVATDELLYNTIFWITACLELITILIKLFFNKTKD